jgi:hypothetical protein
MHYVRFLKRPSFEEANPNQVIISTRVTITTDLGESFYNGNVTLITSIWNQDEDLDREPILRHESQWRAGMRVLKVSIPSSRAYYHSHKSPLLRQAWLQIGVRNETSRDPLASLCGGNLSPEPLNIVSAFSAVNAEFRDGWSVWRRLELTNRDVLCIAETPGSNIACHIWSVTVP